MNNEPIFFKTLLLKGEAGGTIDRIEKTATVGTTDTYTIYLNDGSTTTFNVTNGTSIASIEYTSSSGNVDTYTVTLTDGSTTTFNVTNGEDFTVPTDGVNYYYGVDVPDGYEETSAPSGSGSYATIDDNNVSVATTYSSSKIEQLISGIGGGGVDYSTSEQDTGLKWIDGRPIYQKTYRQKLTSSMSNGATWYAMNDLTNKQIIKDETFFGNDGTMFNYFGGAVGIQAPDNSGVANILLFGSISSISSGNILTSTIWYTKTTDTV